VVDKRYPDDEHFGLIISDIERHVVARDRAPERVNVYEVMRKPVLSVHPDMQIRHCARLFTQFDLSRAPVVAEREVIGIVSFTDLVLKGMVR
jgi:CBS domain-containing protein